MPNTTRPSPDTILAHVQLLRSVDRLLEQAADVREKRNALDQLLSANQSDTHRPIVGAVSKEDQRDG